MTVTLYVSGPSIFSPGNLSAASSDESSTSEEYQSHAQFEQECQFCHDSWNGIDSGLCKECHTEIEAEQDTRSGMHGSLPATDRCMTCHTEHEGINGKLTIYDLKEFPHELAADFSLARHELDYTGDLLECSECHISQPYRASDVECVDCHLTNDTSYMQRHISLFGAECLACHDGYDAMATFEHDAIFLLAGAHADLSCEKCHDQNLDLEVDLGCIDCHEEPAVHLGLFGQDCARCHSDTAWVPARLHQHDFPLDHGDDGKVACATCHQTTYSEYTCYGCHEHEPNDMVEEHQKEGILEIEDCASCHPFGEKE
jgi:hypothetical protein